MGLSAQRTQARYTRPFLKGCWFPYGDNRSNTALNSMLRLADDEPATSPSPSAPFALHLQLYCGVWPLTQFAYGIYPHAHGYGPRREGLSELLSELCIFLAYTLDWNYAFVRPFPALLLPTSVCTVVMTVRHDRTILSPSLQSVIYLSNKLSLIAVK